MFVFLLPRDSNIRPKKNNSLSRKTKSENQKNIDSASQQNKIYCSKKRPHHQGNYHEISPTWKPYTVENISGFPNISYTVKEINDLAKYETGLGDLISARYIKWILDGKAISDADWNTFQDDLVKAGVETIRTINQAGYDRYLASMGK